MKKSVPDPPAVLCVGPGLSHDDAIRYAQEYLQKAVTMATYLPSPSSLKHQRMLSDVLLDMKISKAFLTLALSASPVTVPV